MYLQTIMVWPECASWCSHNLLKNHHYVDTVYLQTIMVWPECASWCSHSGPTNYIATVPTSQAVAKVCLYKPSWCSNSVHIPCQNDSCSAVVRAEVAYIGWLRIPKRLIILEARCEAFMASQNGWTSLEIKVYMYIAEYIWIQINGRLHEMSTHWQNFITPIKW